MKTKERFRGEIIFCNYGLDGSSAQIFDIGHGV